MNLFELREHLECGGEVRRSCWEMKEPGLKWGEHWSISVASIFADDWQPVGELRGEKPHALKFTETAIVDPDWQRCNVYRGLNIVGTCEVKTWPPGGQVRFANDCEGEEHA